jgi:nitric oxide reductase activation protein
MHRCRSDEAVRGESRKQGCHPFGIAVDEDGQSGLPHRFARSGYAVIEGAPRSPYEVADGYRRLTP